MLSRLSHLGQELQATGLSEDGVTTALSSYMSDNLLETPPYWVASAGEALWARLQEAGAGLPHISRALAAIITHSSHDHAVGAVELCFGLLAVDKCPVGVVVPSRPCGEEVALSMAYTCRTSFPPCIPHLTTDAGHL